MFPVADIGIISIATNSYFDYWKSLVESAYEVVDSGGVLDFYLFTDEPERSNELDPYLDKFNFVFIRIPSYGWPDATLKRYEIITENKNILQNKILMYLDSDMLIRGNFVQAVKSEAQKNKMVLVCHPGFFRTSGLDLFLFYLKNPGYLVRDLRLLVSVGGLGSWETNRASLAYVPRRKRKQYVCGGIWFGLNNEFIEYVRILKINVSEDEKKSITAVWHDESHLNKIASDNQIRVLDSRYCFDPRYANLQNLPNVIEAVNKHG
jgi:hypothetical protein